MEQASVVKDTIIQNGHCKEMVDKELDRALLLKPCEPLLKNSIKTERINVLEYCIAGKDNAGFRLCG